MRAAILAGGLGTRLRSVVPEQAKAIAAVGSKPFLLHILGWLRRQGIDEVVLCLGYRWRDIQAIVGDGSSLGLRIEYSVEGTPLGTAGALKHASGLLQDTFLALNGDSYCDISLSQLEDSHRRNEATASLVLVRVSDTSRYGAVEIDESGLITAFREKQQSSSGSGWVNAGIYVLEPSVLSLIPSGVAASLEREVFPMLLARQYRIHGFLAEGYFIDIGTPEAYIRSQTELEEML